MCSDDYSLDKTYKLNLTEDQLTVLRAYTQGQCQFHVWRFYDAPEELREIFNYNGGDEDWLVITRSDMLDLWTPNWIEMMDSCNDPDKYIINNTDIVVFVGSHS
jgi:hypothetical protein